MPIYEYQCKECQRRFELLRAYGQKDAEAACPACGATRATRQLSVFAAPVSGGEDGGACGWSPSAGACVRPG